jgi:hypothetical protein
MAKTLQFRRGTTTELNAITGAVGELFVDTTKDTVVVMDGTTAGGFPLATEAALTSGLAAKASTSALTSGLAAKADASALTSGLASKQDALVSGTSIKTINNQSLLGSGNITISGGSGGSADLSQVSTDITPLFDAVYDLGTTDKRFYDAYLGNKLDINQATLAGSMTGSAGGTTTQVLHTFNNETFINNSALGNHDANTIMLGGVNTGMLGYPMALPYELTANANPALVQSYFDNLPTDGSVTIVVHALNGQGQPVDVTTHLVGRGVILGSLKTLVLDTDISELVAGNGLLNISITGVSSITVVTPDTREYTLASNATIVAPTVVADSALLGNTYFELDTITPHHIVGPYTDVKGTLVVDGNLTVVDDVVASGNLKVVKNLRTADLSIQQDTVALGTVVSKTVVAPVVETVSYTYGDVNVSLHFNHGYFTSSQATLYFEGLGANTAAVNFFAPGNVITLTADNITWTFRIDSQNNLYAGTYEAIIYYTPLSSSNPSYAYPGSWNSNIYNPSMSTQALGSTYYKLTIDSTAIALSTSNKLYANGVDITSHITQQFTIVDANTYTASVAYDFLAVGDTLTYVPATASITFKSNTGSNAVAISYNNITGAITYGGLTQSITVGITGSIYSSNSAAGIAVATGGSYTVSNAVSIGSAAVAGDSAVTIGSSAGTYGSGTSAVSIGYGANATGFSSIAMGNGAYVHPSANYGVAMGTSAQAMTTGSTAIGYSMSANGANGVTAFGGDPFGRNKNAIVNQYMSNIQNFSTGKLYYGSNNATTTPDQSWGLDLVTLLGHQDVMAMVTATVMLKLPYWAGGNGNTAKWSIFEIKAIVRTTGYDTFEVIQQSNTKIASGGDTDYDSFSHGLEVYSNRYLFPFINKNTNDYVSIVCKLEFKSFTMG